MSNQKKVLTKEDTHIPEGYDFSTRKVNWKEYENDFLLRTDAVWEKQQLVDYFRLYMKCFYFDKAIKSYQFIEPEDLYTILYEGWALEDIQTFPGFTPTGRTNSFQASVGPKQRIAVPTQTNYLKQDYYDLCALRFDKWYRCDIANYDDRHTKYDTVRDQKNYKTYPCYKEYYEASYACQDDLFDFLMELAYAKRANDYFEGDYASHEIQIFPSAYDTPKQAERKTLTY